MLRRVHTVVHINPKRKKELRQPLKLPFVPASSPRQGLDTTPSSPFRTSHNINSMAKFNDDLSNNLSMQSFKLFAEKIIIRYPRKSDCSDGKLTAVTAITFWSVIDKSCCCHHVL